MSCLAPLDRKLACKRLQGQRKGKIVYRFFFFFLFPFQNKWWLFIWLTHQCHCCNNKLVICPWNVYPTQWCCSDQGWVKIAWKEIRWSPLAVLIPTSKASKSPGCCFQEHVSLYNISRNITRIARNYAHASISCPTSCSTHWSPNNHNL